MEPQAVQPLPPSGRPCRGGPAWVLFLAAFAAASLAMHRYLVTPIGFASLGRIWQFFVSYAEFGFIRRGLVGTLLNLAGIESWFANPYWAVLAVCEIALLLFCLALAWYCKRRDLGDWRFLATVAFSPALILQLGYTGTDNLDLFVLALAAANLLWVRRPATFGLVAALGVLVHELFLFTLPAQLLALREAHGRLAARHWAAALAPPLVALGALLAWGDSQLSREVWETRMAEKLSLATGVHGLWSGYQEIHTGLADNLALTLGNYRDQLRQNPWAAAGVILPLFYLGLLLERLRRLEGTAPARLLAGVCLVPLLATPLATDLYRWIGLSCNLALLWSLRAAGEGCATPRLDRLLLSFSLLGPLGGYNFARPFPALQFLLAKFAGT
ncbi:MAG: hypothetical protein KatS3mg124_0207 [Porticoccaceae bacterium]|nr:MAG: hypothetical protein KatS3mg124_0207 [Porticoccaceae bacterium]